MPEHAAAHLSPATSVVALALNDLPVKFRAAVDAGLAEAADDGSRTVPFQLLKVGEFVYQGMFEDREFAIDEDFLGAMVKNFKRDQRMGMEPVVTFGHPFDLDATPADGWITSVEATEDGLFGQVKLLSHAVEAVETDRFRYFSATFAEDFVDENGKERGPTLLAGAITNTPFLRGMETFGLAACWAGGASEIRMADEKAKTPAAATPDPTPDPGTATDERDDRIKALEDELAAEREKREAAEAKNESLSERFNELESTVNGLEQVAASRTITDAIKFAEGRLVLSPERFKRFFGERAEFDKDPVAGFAAGTFASVEKFMEWAKAEEPVARDAKLGRQSNPASGDADVLAFAASKDDNEAKRLKFKDAEHFREVMAQRGATFSQEG